MKNILFLSLVPSLLIPSGVVIATPPVYLSTVTIEELRVNPEKYNGQYVKTIGVMVSGFEAGPALSDSTVERNGVKYLKEPSIYLNNVTVQNQRDCFSVGLPPVTFCTVDVIGLFKYGGSYGHASYRSKFQISGSVQPPTGYPVKPGTGVQTEPTVKPIPPTVEPGEAQQGESTTEQLRPTPKPDEAEQKPPSVEPLPSIRPEAIPQIIESQQKQGKLNIDSIDTVKLTQDKKKSPVYEVQARRRVRVLFLLPVTMPITIIVNADTGSVETVRKPWWNFLAF